MKKRMFSMLAASVLLMVCLAGCGSDSTSAPSSASGSASAGGESGDAGGSGDGYAMTLIMSQRDEFLSSLESASNEAAQKNNVSLTVQDAQNDMSKQMQFVETARNSGNDVCIVNIVDSEAGQEIVDAAGDMKIVFVNRAPSDISVLNENAICVTSDETQAGHLQAEYLANYFKEKGQTEIKYILLEGIIGHVSTTLRTESVLEGLEEAGITAVEATAPLAGKYDRATAMNLIAPLLKTIEYDCIISNNDSMALGAIEAMEAAGLDPTAIPIVGVDATADGRQAIKEGKMKMSAYQNPIGQGEGAMLAAINMLKGNPTNQDTGFEYSPDSPYRIDVPFESVTIDNVADYD